MKSKRQQQGEAPPSKTICVKISAALFEAARKFARSRTLLKAQLEEELLWATPEMPRVELGFSCSGAAPDLQDQFHFLAASNPERVLDRCNRYRGFSRDLDLKGEALNWWKKLISTLPRRQAAKLQRTWRQLDAKQTQFESRLDSVGELARCLPGSFRQVGQELSGVAKAAGKLHALNLKFSEAVRSALGGPEVMQSELAASIPKRFTPIRDLPRYYTEETGENEVDVVAFFGGSLPEVAFKLAEADEGRERADFARAHLELAEVWLRIFKDATLLSWKCECGNPPVDLSEYLARARSDFEGFLKEFVSACKSRPEDGILGEPEHSVDRGSSLASAEVQKNCQKADDNPELLTEPPIAARAPIAPSDPTSAASQARAHKPRPITPATKGPELLNALVTVEGDCQVFLEGHGRARGPVSPKAREVFLTLAILYQKHEREYGSPPKLLVVKTHEYCSLRGFTYSKGLVDKHFRSVRQLGVWDLEHRQWKETRSKRGVELRKKTFDGLKFDIRATPRVVYEEMRIQLPPELQDDLKADAGLSAARSAATASRLESSKNSKSSKRPQSTNTK